MAFTASEIVQIRRWLGYPLAPYNGDGIAAATGRITWAGPEAEDAVRATLASLLGLQSKIEALQTQMAASAVDEIHIDAARGMLALNMLGRTYVRQLAAALELKVRQDVFSPAKPDPYGSPFDRPI